MYGLIVELYAKTASFRDPSAQLYHETLPLPPPTTIAGIAGAALGLSFEDTLTFFRDNGIMIGCNGKSGGKGKDLWNYFKIKSGEGTHAIILRNFLFDVKVELFFACEKQELILELSNAFENPVYAITLGNSDEIARICSVKTFEKLYVECKKILMNTWLPDNFLRNIMIDWAMIQKSKINITLRPPILKNLPYDFEFDNYGARKATKYRDITFIGENYYLETEAEVFVFGGKFTAMMELS
jgi:CRISPR-associated protein Cas5t